MVLRVIELSTALQNAFQCHQLGSPPLMIVHKKVWDVLKHDGTCAW